MYKLKIELDGNDFAAIEPLLYELITWGWEEEEDNSSKILTFFFDLEQKGQDFRNLIVEQCPYAIIIEETISDPSNWENAWREFFTPIDIEGRFLVLPDWLSSDDRDRIPIIITPKMAFGTGHHATTHLCLLALSRLYDQGLPGPGAVFLDLGTGSGILGIACSRLGMTGLGLDIDPVAVENARDNIKNNEVQEKFEVLEGDLNTLEPDSKFNLILGNILSSTLQRLAPDIVKLLDSPGVLILSGILTEQADAVALRYRQLGLGEPLTLKREEWSALIWVKDAVIHEPERLVA